jgi:hypothetical protein
VVIGVLERGEADEALARLGAESDRIAQSLLAMDAHPGQHLLGADAREAVGALWGQFEAYRRVLEQAREVRGRRERPGPAELAELTALLTQPVVVLDARQVPIERRSLTGPALVLDEVGLTDLVARMKAGYAVVVAQLARHEELAARLEALRDVQAQARRARELVVAKVVVVDLPEVPDPDPRDPDAVARALSDARALLANLTGLLDRRAELRGRLEAYRAKATGRGHAEDPELGALHRRARDVLFTAPCDLRAATVAVAHYQRAVLDRTEEAR